MALAGIKQLAEQIRRQMPRLAAPGFIPNQQWFKKNRVAQQYPEYSSSTQD